METKKDSIFIGVLSSVIILLFLSGNLSAQCINTFPAVEDFESGPVWTSNQFYAANDWAWGTPAHLVINSAGSGTKSWCLGGLSGAFYQFNEQSWVQSPCYDFTNLQYPHIWLKIFWESEWKFDGTKLQSSIDNGTTWVTIGAFGDPNDCNTANWYNTNSTSSFSSGTITGGGAKPVWFPATDPTAKHSWAGNTHPVDVADDPSHSGVTCYSGHGSTTWLVAQHCLTGLAGQPNVIFRMAFSCGYACNGYDGFAFDSVAISNGIPNAATFTKVCAGPSTINFNATPIACPTNTYAWNFGDAASGASNISASQNPSHTFSGPGSYTVSLISSGGACNPPDTIKQVVNIMSASVTATNADCSGPGSATVTTTSAIGPVTYTWSPSGGNAATATGLAAGSYTCSVSDAGSCPVTANITITNAGGMTATIASTSVSCNGGSNGSATVTPTSGTGPYTYAWAPTGGNAAIATGLSQGNYSVTVSAGTCSVTVSVIIAEPTPLTATVASSPASCAIPGSATATPNGGTSPYTYSWTPMGGTAITASGLPAGNYTVLVTDANTCTTTAAVTVANVGGLTAAMATTSVSCNGGTNGSATVTPGAGSTPYTYTWSPTGGNAASASGFSAGVYTVTIKDASNCTVTATANITEPTLLTVTATFTNVTCNGGTNGIANVVPNGGTAGYTYSWTPSGGTGATATGLSFGNYTVIVLDANLCPAATTVSIGQPTALTTTVSTTPANCGQANGSASVTATGATPPYTYTWSPSGGNTTSATGLTGGNYSVTIADANNCILVTPVAVSSTAPFTVSVTSTPVTCFGGTDGSATATASGSAGPFTYTWQPTGGNTASTGNILPMGNYTVNVTDNTSGCTNTTTVAVIQPATPVTVIASGQTICNGQTGTITANAVGGNGAPFNYTWNTGAATANTTATPSVTTTYTVLATDSKNCPAGDTATIIVLPPLTIVVTSNDTICPGQQATLTATPGGGNGNYSITWLPGNLTGSPISVNPTTTTIYTATVTDGCTIAPASATGQVVVTSIPIVAFNANPASGCMPVCAVFAGIATSVPGNNVVAYSWNFGDGGNSGTGINTSHCYTVSGNYDVTLYGITQKGCRDSVKLTNLIHVFPIPIANFDATPGLTTDIYDNTLSFYDLSIGNNITTWQWFFPNGAIFSTKNPPAYTFEPEGTYPVTLIVTNANGCADTITKEIIIKPDYTFYAPNAFTPNGDGTNEFFRPTGTAWDLNSYNLWVFDRWGNQVFHTNDTLKGWDGTRRGYEVQEDVYVWKVELKDIFGTGHEYNGHVSIVK